MALIANRQTDETSKPPNQSQHPTAVEFETRHLLVTIRI